MEASRSSLTTAGFSPAGTPSALGSFLQFTGAACYGFDAILREPNLPTLRSALDLTPAWERFFAEAEIIAPANRLKTHLTRLLEDDLSRQAALKEYNALFHAPELPVQLWESVWLSPEKILFTAETSAVRAWYARFAWEINRVGYEAEDHLGLETAFCGWLYDTAADREDAAPSGPALPIRPTLADLRAFMAEHFSRWAPQCFGQLRIIAETPFWGHLLASAAALSVALAEDAG